MTPRLWLLCPLLLSCSTQPPGDGRSSDASPNQGAAAALDTVRGELHVVGSEPARQLVLKRGDGSLSLSVDRAALLWRADGMDVCLRLEHRDGKSFVRGYSIRAIGGSGAVDGIVRIRSDSAVLERPAAPPLPLGSPQANADLAPDSRAALTSSATAMLGRPVLPLDSLSNSCDSARR